MSNLMLAKPQVITAAQKGLVIAKNTLIKQSPIILAGVAVSGVITTGIMAAKAGIKVDKLIKEAEYEKGEPLTIQEKIQTSWKPCAPAIISAGLTIGAIVTSTAISQHRQAALAGLYALSETALKDYQAKIEKEYGPKEAQKIKDGVNADKVTSSSIPPWDDAVLPQGETLCYDKFSGRYFLSSIQKISSAIAEVNEAIYGGDMCVSLNEFYGILANDKLRPNDMGEQVGWNIDANCKPYFTSCLTSDMKPCLVLDWANGHEPTIRYRDI